MHRPPPCKTLLCLLTPVVALLPPAAAAQVDVGSMAYGPFAASQVPTLQQAALLLLVLLLAVFAWPRLRRGQQHLMLGLLGVGALLTLAQRIPLIDNLVAAGFGEYELVAQDGPSFNTVEITPAILNTYTNATDTALQIKSIQLPDDCPQYPTGATSECRVGAGVAAFSQCEIDCQPAAPNGDNIVALNFRIDDSANATYQPGDGLAWKGSFSFDAATRTITHNPAWPGPYPMVYDDGPWTQGGHEPEGSVAGDNIWGVTVWLDTSVGVTLEYGAISGSVDGSDGVWIWPGANAVVPIAQGTTGTLDLPGLVIPANET